MALKQASISFVETIKSSSPLFTVIISRMLIGEMTGFWTNVSLVPIMIGLALCSSFEINFSFFGFLSAILTNLTEWLVKILFKFKRRHIFNKFSLFKACKWFFQSCFYVVKNINTRN